MSKISSYFLLYFRQTLFLSFHLTFWQTNINWTWKTTKIAIYYFLWNVAAKNVLITKLLLDICDRKTIGEILYDFVRGIIVKYMMKKERRIASACIFKCIFLLNQFERRYKVKINLNINDLFCINIWRTHLFMGILRHVNDRGKLIDVSNTFGYFLIWFEWKKITDNEFGCGVWSTIKKFVLECRSKGLKNEEARKFVGTILINSGAKRGKGTSSIIFYGQSLCPISVFPFSENNLIFSIFLTLAQLFKFIFSQSQNRASKNWRNFRKTKRIKHFFSYNLRNSKKLSQKFRNKEMLKTIWSSENFTFRIHKFPSKLKLKFPIIIKLSYRAKLNLQTVWIKPNFLISQEKQTFCIWFFFRFFGD